jgi:hypothetical protein
VREVPRWTSETTTVAPATAAPLWSVTVPRMRPAVDWAKAGTEKRSRVNVANNNREAGVLRMSCDEQVLTERDSIGEAPPFLWSDSHTTIGETVSSEFKSWMES